MGVASGPRLLGIYFLTKMLTKTVHKIPKTYNKSCDKDVKICKDVELQRTPVSSTIAVTNA